MGGGREGGREGVCVCVRERESMYTTKLEDITSRLNASRRKV